MDTLTYPLLAALAALAGLAAVAWARRLQHRLDQSEAERRRTADELNRRLSELFSLQELSYVLSDSLQLDRIVEQVVRYAMRFLDARGALVALADEAAGAPLHVAAAEGTLADLADQAIARDDPGLVARSIGSERLELIRRPESGGASGEPVRIAGGVEAECAASVPLRAHGVVVGTLVIVEPHSATFGAEDIRLLSTVATHTAVVLANARFFGMVQHAKEQWETAFDALSEGIAVVDEEGRIRRANRSLAELLGRPLPAVIGEHLCHALFGKSLALMTLLDAARRGDRPAALVTRSERLGRTVRVNAAPIPIAGADQSLVVLVEDVTDQQAMEAQLIQSEKLAAVGQLISGIAHELNNPLTSIAGLSEFLLEQKQLGPNDRGHLKVIHDQAQRAGRIVRNLLTFARKGPAETERVDLNDVVQRTLRLMSYDLKLKDVETRKELAGGLPDVLGDRHALQQVVLNLLTNAAQAVAANQARGARRVTVKTWVDDRVHLRVTDTGPGIPDSVVPQIFTPFFTTKEPGEGTGLGLSITYSIVEAHGGHVAYERGPEGGAAFRVDLPPAPAPAPASARPARAGQEPDATRLPLPASPSTPARRILLVDDDPAVRRVVQALFGREGHTVEAARSAQHALELAQARHYDLVIADGRATARGKGAGRLLVEELVVRWPALRDRILVATGDVRPATEQALARLGLRYVRKPFNLRDLREEAARAWGGAATTLS
ncbi:MAG: hybrid sensor histidine kinase/response regulator [Gemmatimonadales bacterium]